MRILEALKLLEAATIERKTRDIDTPEIREALEVLAPYCRPESRIRETKKYRDTSHDSSESPASVGSYRGMVAAAAAWFHHYMPKGAENEPQGNTRELDQDDE